MQNEEFEMPKFLQQYNEGCSDVMETVKKPMPKDIATSLENVKSGRKIVTEKDKVAIVAAVNNWTKEEQLYVCKVMPPDILIEAIRSNLMELAEIRSEISAIARHTKNI